jgi:hypothetical protein
MAKVYLSFIHNHELEDRRGDGNDEIYYLKEFGRVKHWLDRDFERNEFNSYGNPGLLIGKATERDPLAFSLWEWDPGVGDDALLRNNSRDGRIYFDGNRDQTEYILYGSEGRGEYHLKFTVV